MARGPWMVLGAAVLWGTSFPAVEVGLGPGGLDPYSFLFYRFAVATLTLFAIALLWRRARFDLFGDWRLLGLGVLNALGYVAQFVGQDLTTASKASLLVNVNVLATALLAGWLLRERLPRGILVACAFALVGLVLLTTDGDLGALRTNDQELVGDALAFATGLCWTVYILAAKRYFERRQDVEPIGFTLVIFVVTTVVLLALALATGRAAFGGNAVGAGATLYLALLPSVGAFLLWQQGLRETPASVCSILLLFEVVVAIAISVPLLREDLGGWTGVGAVLIVGAIYLASRAPRAMPSPVPVEARTSGA